MSRGKFVHIPPPLLSLSNLKQATYDVHIPWQDGVFLEAADEPCSLHDVIMTCLHQVVHTQIALLHYHTIRLRPCKYVHNQNK